MLTLYAAAVRSGAGVPGMGAGVVDGVPGAGPTAGARVARPERGPKPRWSDEVLLAKIREVPLSRAANELGPALLAGAWRLEPAGRREPMSF